MKVDELMCHSGVVRLASDEVFIERVGVASSPEVETVGLDDEVPEGTEKRTAIDEAFRHLPSYVRRTGIPR